MAISAAPNVPLIRRANKAELAEWFGVSLPTIEAWIRKGCPALQKGSRGIPWVFDLMEVAQWRFGGQAPEDPEKVDPDDLPPRDRKDWYDAEKKKRELQVSDGELIQAADHERELARVIKSLLHVLETLGDVLERDAGISGGAVERVQAVVDRIREQLYQDLIEDVPG